MGIYGDNFYSWLERQNATERVAMDGNFDETKIRREGKGSEKGGRFAKKPETLAKEDERDVLSPSKPPISKSKYRGLRDAQAKKLSTMGTFDLITGEAKNYDSGFQVSFQEATTESPNTGSYIPDEEYDRKVEALKKEIGTEPDLGHWDEDEISFHCESLEKAMEVARRHNQEAIWNWSKGEPIKNEDFVGRTHWVNGENRATKNYHAHKPNPNLVER